jgi:hypothetical protein
MPNSQPFRFSLGAVLVVITWLGIVLGLGHSLGAHGFGIGFFICAASWYAISFTRTPMFQPLNRERWSVIDIVVMLAVWALLHAMALPAVTSGPHPRRRGPAPTVPAAPQPESEPEKVR